MTPKDPIAEKLPSNADYPQPTAWLEGRERLAGGQWYWLATVRPDGRPHVMPILAICLDNAFYFSTNANARKTKNLAHDAHCVITVAREDAHLVVEGSATRVLDEATLQQVAAAYADKYDWHVTVRNGQFDADYGAPTAGAPPFYVYTITPNVAFGFGTDGTFSPTRWRF